MATMYTVNNNNSFYIVHVSRKKILTATPPTLIHANTHKGVNLLNIFGKDVIRVMFESSICLCKLQVHW